MQAGHSELEDMCAHAFCDVLGAAQIGPDDDFFELGGHSFAAVRLAEHLTTHAGVVVTPDMVFHASTPRAMTKLLVRSDDTSQSMAGLDLDRAMSVELDPGIVPRAPTEWPVRLNTVLLTGATGFLGAHLLRELLDSTNASVRCLVRAESVSAAFGRIRDALAGYGLWHAGFAGRIVAIPGDLGQPRLRLSQQAFAALTREVDAVYHAGASVDFTRSYTQLEAVNVQGTEEIIRLCALAAAPLHHISTVAVVANRPGPASPVGEDEPLRGAQDLYNGYAVSKWVAERFVARAADRGMGTIVYRLPLLTGSTKTGLSNPNDLAVWMLQGCVELGLAPDTTSASYVVPIDFVVRAIRHISLSTRARGRTFHVIEHEPISPKALFEQVRNLGFDVELVPYTEWRRRAVVHVADKSDHPLCPLMAVLGERFFDDTPRLSNHNTREALAGSGITCPPLDNALLQRYLDRLLS